jgi:hypothetical protein
MRNLLIERRRFRRLICLLMVEILHQENAPLSVTPGAIRFNTDSMKLEYYRGGPVGFGTTTQTGEWVNLTTDSPDIQTGGARGIFGGG